MKIFIYEYTCAAGTGDDPLTRKLRTEGWSMLAAVLEDFQSVAEIEVVTLLGEQGAFPGGPAFRRVKNGEAEAAFDEMARGADYTLVIAPECDDILWKRCLRVEAVGGRLLGASPAAVRLTGDKLALARHWRSHGIPTPDCQLVTANLDARALSFPIVCKPRHGAGSTATFLVQRPEELPPCLLQARAEGWEGESLLQPFVAGQPASVALLVGPVETFALLPAAQRLSADGRFRYLGGSVPLPAALAERATRLARRALAAVPGLNGYVGVDLVLAEADDGSLDQAIEINPRLTTSYIGLRALSESNLAEALLLVVQGRPVPPLTWRRQYVRFDADGQSGDSTAS